MDDNFEMAIKKLCCTCLSKDRKLFQLCRINDGVNNLYWLLTYDSEAYREGFYKNTASLFICWECKALMCRIVGFREQACEAQKKLSSITDGGIDLTTLTICLSKLSHCYKTSYDREISTHDVITDDTCDNFIDCGPLVDIKTEADDLDDIPLSELHNNYDISDNESYHTGIKTDKEITESVITENSLVDVKPDYKKRRKNNYTANEKMNLKLYKKHKKTKIKDVKKNIVVDDKTRKYFTSTRLTEAEMLESIEKRKMAVIYSDAAFKCETCVEGFASLVNLERHNSALHSEKYKHTQCDLCLIYVKTTSLARHREDHFMKHQCHFCDYISHSTPDILKHLKNGHAMQNLIVPVQRKKGQRKTPEVLNPGSKPRRNQAMTDKRTPFGYLCTECNKYFDNKNQRWKHIQSCHREGFKCATCGKRFAFKNNLSRHEQLHQGPPPREKCDICHKMIRVDLVKTHARIHADRERFSCAECQKTFVSRASYEHHLKYTQAHAAVDILKYKCGMCDKGYRSRGELRDHVNYQHMGKTQHKCPICGKALATRRCITRHVRRAHDGVKESPRDKICQQCGKAFRDKKGLREHEFIHTGERPLSCEICGCTFRQSASLYTHRKRVHKIHPQRRCVELLDSVAQNAGGGS